MCSVNVVSLIVVSEGLMKGFGFHMCGITDSNST